MKKWLLDQLHKLEQHVNKPWYPFLLALLAFSCHFILIMPVDTLYVTSNVLIPKRWISSWLATTVGFAMGAMTMATLVQHYGIRIIDRFAPGIVASPVWTQAEAWMHHYGVLAVGGLSLIPLTLHPLVALAALQNMPLPEIGISIFIGRFIKYGILGWLAAYLPAKLPISKSLKSGTP